MAAPASSPAHRRAALGVLAAAGLGLGSEATVARLTQLGGAGHVVLLGDSVFDNKVYVGGEPDVVAHLRGQLPDRWRATLAAVDGATISSLPGQLSRIPADATHLVVSIGGNDALRQEAALGESVRSVGEGLARLAALRERFRQDYGTMLDAVLARGLPTALCTVYDPRFADPMRRELGIAGLALFNDVIVRAAFSHGLPLLDLRLICDDDRDFANPIEPSGQGGGKIAASIVQLMSEHDFARGRSEVITGRPGPR